MLTPLIASSAIADAYLLTAGLNADGKPSGLEPSGDYPAAFAAGYNNYAKDGVVLGAINSGGNKSIIESFMRGPHDVASFANALAMFWATVAVTPGVPSHGGTTVLSVTNNAASLAGIFANAIIASLTSTESKPYFLNLVNNIQTMAVSQIVWSVTELMPTVPPSPMTFPEIVL